MPTDTIKATAEKAETKKPYPAVRSEAIEDIVEQAPSWLLNWGINIIFFTIVLVIAFSYFIKYPDIVRAPFSLTSVNTPKSVVAKVEGKVNHLLVRNNEPVSKDQVLFYLDNTASPIEITNLSEWVNQAIQDLNNGSKTLSEDFYTRPLPFCHQLGMLQEPYEKLNDAHQGILSHQNGGFYHKKQLLLEQEILDLKKLQLSLAEQQKLYKQDLALTEENYQVQKLLYEQKAISNFELKAKKSDLYSKQLPVKQLEMNIITNYSSQSAKQKELLELEKLRRDHTNAFIQSLRTLRSAIENWKDIYALKAPISGSVTFVSLLEEGQHIQAGQEVSYVIPGKQEEYGVIDIPQYNFGKVKVGQKVIVKFDSYPFQEFGTVDGKIDYIASIPSKDGSFMAKVNLPAGLRTSYGKNIVVKPGMKASAEIVTDDTRLIDLVFQNLIKRIN